MRHKNVVNNISLLSLRPQRIISLAIVGYKISRSNRAYNKYTEAWLSITLLDKTSAYTVNSIANFSVRQDREEK